MLVSGFDLAPLICCECQTGVNASVADSWIDYAGCLQDMRYTVSTGTMYSAQKTIQVNYLQQA